MKHNIEKLWMWLRGFMTSALLFFSVIPLIGFIIIVDGLTFGEVTTALNEAKEMKKERKMPCKVNYQSYSNKHEEK